MEITERESIGRLKAQFGSDPENMQAISEWEAEIIRLRDAEKFANFSTTKAVTEALKKRLRDVIRIRAEGAITHAEMLSYDARRDELRMVLRLLSPDFEAELADIRRQMEDALAQ